MSHEFSEHIQVFLLLCSLILVKVLIFVVCVLIVLVACNCSCGLLLEIAVQKARNELNHDRLKSCLTRHIHGHAFEENSLPQVCEFARMEPNRVIEHFEASHCKLKNFREVPFENGVTGF